MKDFFKLEDFDPCIGMGTQTAHRKIVEFANAKLSAEVSNWPVVYSVGPENKYGWWPEKQMGEAKAVAQARLAFIEEIGPCKHEPKDYIIMEADGLVYEMTCRHCGVELVAEWKIKGEV